MGLKPFFLLLLTATLSWVNLNAEEMPQLADNQSVWLILDRSLSMNNNDSEALRFKAIEAFLKLLPDSMYFGVQLFNGDTETIIPLTALDSLKKAEFIDKIIAEGSKLGYYTDIRKALDEALKTLLSDRPQMPLRGYHVILITDGRQEVRGGQRAVRQSLAHLQDEIIPHYRKLQIPIYSLGLSASSDTLLLQNISQITGGTYFLALEAMDLNAGLDSIFNNIQNNAQRQSKKNQFLKAAELFDQSPDEAVSYLKEKLQLKTGDNDYYLYLFAILFGLSFLANLTIIRYAFNPKDPQKAAEIPFYLRENLTDSDTDAPKSSETDTANTSDTETADKTETEEQVIEAPQIIEADNPSETEPQTPSNTEMADKNSALESEDIIAEPTDKGILFTIKENSDLPETEATHDNDNKTEALSQNAGAEEPDFQSFREEDSKLENISREKLEQQNFNDEEHDIKGFTKEDFSAEEKPAIPEETEELAKNQEIPESEKEQKTKEPSEAQLSIPQNILTIHCKFHTNKPAVTQCTDCAIPLCNSCVVELDKKPYCAECAQKREIKRMLGI
jgi:hypothetical protein